ncbi:unnamed protein product [Closterium sp. Naga37s-1]|nr:unnamed protein product [Closterium sp. Naga37s-1]
MSRCAEFWMRHFHAALPVPPFPFRPNPSSALTSSALLPWRQVRGEMERLVGNGLGVLEVSVKHSGSLFLWAGARRGAYAKNSYGNEYSAVGVWVLGETLRNAWGEGVVRQKQKELSEYLEVSWYLH